MGFKCTQCGAFLYSRASGVCPDCRASLPKDQLLSDEEKKHREAEKAQFKVMVEQLKNTSGKKGIFARLRGS